MKKNLLLLAVLAIFMSACEKINQEPVTENLAIKLNDQASSGHLRIAVVSDPHYLHPSLLINGAENGKAFQSNLSRNPSKALMAYSAPIFKSIFVDLMNEKPDILLICGDLTKDGEMVSHEQMAGYFKMLQENGTKVYVIPGNNDIRNTGAVGYDGDMSNKVANVSPDQFRMIYYDFGYKNAISKDDNSLSYVVEPVPGLWIIGIDACQYNPVGSRQGKLSSKTQMWIFQQLNKARENKKMVFGMMHHNLIEHMSFQDKIIGPSSVLDSSQAITEAFISLGMEVMFTGHSHANDISMYMKGGNTIYDITTGSTIAGHSPYRFITLKNKEMEVQTRYVTDISEPLPGGMKFRQYADEMQSELLNKFFANYLKMSPFSLSDSMAKASAPLARNAYLAFFEGDEKMPPADRAMLSALEAYNPKPEFFLAAINSFWTDLGIRDNKWHVKLMEK